MIPLLVAAIADLCTPIPRGVTPPDATAANAYADVGDDARTAGDPRIAATAYRKALVEDPTNARARAALDELCKADRETRADATMLAAIAAYQRGDLDGARIQFEALAAEGPTSAAAHLFLGLIALAEHDGGRAKDDLELALADPRYAVTARALLRQARRDGRLAVLLLVAQEYDTNPQLLPDTPPAGAMTGPPRADADLLATSTVTWRPTSWSYLRDVLAWREQYDLSSLDFFSNAVEGGVELQRGADHFGLGYAFDYELLAASPYAIANGATLAYRHDYQNVAFVMSYGLRRRDFEQSAEAGFTGWVASADAGIIVHATPRVDLEARALGVREFTADPTFSDYAGGARVAARLRIGSQARVSALATGWYATYDAPQPDGTQRDDLHGELGVDAEYDLTDHMLVTCAAQAISNGSTVVDFVYARFVARCGLAVAWAGP